MSHCGGHQNCPNVVLAGQRVESAELERRYQSELADSDSRGTQANLQAFELELATSRAVMGSTLNKLKPIVLRDRDVFATFHELAELRFLRESAPDGPDWNVVRPIAEIAMLGGPRHIHQLHYSALSLDGRSLPHYSECTIILRDEMIAHRSSLFQENSAVFVHRHGYNVPPGSRCTWSDRVKLCVVKVGGKIKATTKPAEFPEFLLKSGAGGIDDEFVEVQIFGPMTFRTFEKVSLKKSGTSALNPKRPRKRRGTTDELALKEYCRETAVTCEQE